LKGGYHLIFFRTPVPLFQSSAPSCHQEKPGIIHRHEVPSEKKVHRQEKVKSSWNSPLFVSLINQKSILNKEKQSGNSFWAPLFIQSRKAVVAVKIHNSPSAISLRIDNWLTERSA
jgi:hypothetical protein